MTSKIVSIPKRVLEALNLLIFDPIYGGGSAVSIPKRVLEALNPFLTIFQGYAIAVSIPKRVLEALNLSESAASPLFLVSIPKRVLEALNQKGQKKTQKRL